MLLAETYKDRLWTKDFINASIVNFALMMSMYLLLVTMAIYAAQEYDASMSMAGLVASIYIIGSMFGRLFGGKQISKTGSKKMLVISSFFVLIFTLMYFIPLGIFGLIILRFLHGMAMGYAFTATGTIVAQIIPASRNGEGIGYFSMSVVLSTAIGPLIGVMMITYGSFTYVFIFSTVMAVISLILGLTVRAPQVRAPKQTGPKKFRLSDYFETRALPISIVIFIMAFGYSGILSFVTGYAQEINLVQAGSIYFTVYGITVLLSRPFTGPLLDRKGANIIMYPAMISFVIGMLIISQASFAWVFLAAAVLLGFGYGNIQSITQALAIKVTPPHRMGLANSTYFIFLDLGLGIGPFLLGYIIPAIGYRGMYVALAAVIAVGIVAYHLLHGRKDKALTQSGNV